MGVGQLNYIQLPAGDGLHSAVTAHCLFGDAGNIHTFVASRHESQLAMESLLWSLLESLHASLVDSRLKRAAL
jgi:hypothetical protein